MRAFLLGALVFVGGVAIAQGAADPEVKKSSAGICHERGSGSYGRTQNFEPFESMEKCLASGGRRAANAPTNRSESAAPSSASSRYAGKLAFIAGLLAVVGGAIWLAKRGSAGRAAKLNEP